MNITFTARKTNLDERFKERSRKKLNKFDRFFDSANAFITVTQEKERYTVEVTIKAGGMIYRSEKTANDMYEAIDSVSDSLFKQIVKNKSRLEKRLRNDAFLEIPEDQFDADSNEYRIVKSKRFSIKPMMVEEAILQMDMLGHEFFIFRNGETNEINVIYKRHDKNYGLIEPEDI